ncbi:MAG: imidazole glycerol phosphate synthase subunit HisH [Candidatus Lokiarchaeota archaeon]|nr:imidazole glycerol phosphate synthase subunit HisH [Candidatus Lokiarchaeota archaeon]
MVNINIIDYKMGNLYSITKGLEKAGGKITIINEPVDRFDCDALVIPGVGAFKVAIQNILPFKNAIETFYKSGKPILGICLGLQLFFTQSHEGGIYNGLDFIKGEVIKFPVNTSKPVPHMGWNTINIKNNQSQLLQDISNETYFYFVHSYYGKPENDKYIISSTNYIVEFPSIIEKENIYLVQFHPEKSSTEGLKLLKNFIKLSE